MAFFWFSLWTLVAFLLMELLAYVLHRFLFHGMLWRIHQTHHVHSESWFEWNDLFSLGFAAVAITLMVWGSADPLHSIAFALGTGVTLYGLAYFVVHDVITHGRFFRWPVRSGWVDQVRRAHNRHHQDIGHHGQEPYGLFLFDPALLRRQAKHRVASDGDHPAEE